MQTELFGAFASADVASASVAAFAAAWISVASVAAVAAWHVVAAVAAWHVVAAAPYSVVPPYQKQHHWETLGEGATSSFHDHLENPSFALA